MRLVTYEDKGIAKLGAVEGTDVVDLAQVDPTLPKNMIGLVAGGAATMAAAQKAVASAPATAKRPLASVSLLPPVPHPGKIVCLGLNYVDHAAEGGHAKPDYPSFFLRCDTSLVAHGKPIIRPKASDKLDYEAELAVVIGKKARHVKKADAYSIIAGYACFNDGSVRDYQRKTNQWTIGKNFDATGGFGPWMITPDEVPPGCVGLSIQTRLNGQVLQNANTSDMIFPVDETIEILSECVTLEPGDVIVMGTPAGVGYARKPPVWMKPGDTCEIVIEKVGTLANGIADEK